MEVRTGGGSKESAERRRVEVQGGDDGITYGGCCCGGEAHDGDGWVGSPKIGEVSIGRTEVVAPFGNAVSFVNGDAGELAL